MEGSKSFEPDDDSEVEIPLALAMSNRSTVQTPILAPFFQAESRSRHPPRELWSNEESDILRQLGPRLDLSWNYVATYLHHQGFAKRSATALQRRYRSLMAGDFEHTSSHPISATAKLHSIHKPISLTREGGCSSPDSDNFISGQDSATNSYISEATTCLRPKIFCGKPWSAEDDERLVKLMLSREKLSWRKLASRHFPHRTHLAIEQRWRRVLQPRVESQSKA